MANNLTQEQVCDGILDRFEQAAVPLAAEYGALPVVGIGHSCGALLQLLITCLFPDTPRAANALISFNNKPVTEAVPGFEELILPLAKQVRVTYCAFHGTRIALFRALARACVVTRIVAGVGAEVALQL